MLATMLFALLAVFVDLALGQHIIAKPGSPKDIKITSQNTLNTTNVPLARIAFTGASPGQITLSFVNNLNSNNVTAYVSGLDSNGKLVMLQPDGQYYYPVAGLSAIPQPVGGNIAIPVGPTGSTTNITLPGYLVAGRVWFADGGLQFFTVPGAGGANLVQPSAASPSDPNVAVNWGFVELTNIATGIYANISYVDFVGLPLGMALNGAAGLQTALGVTANAAAGVCSKLTQRARSGGAAWDQLCVTTASGTILRVLAPGLLISNNKNALSTVFTKYVDQVWQRFNTTPLVIDTQASPGVINCTVANDLMTCGSDSLTYSKPTSSDIFGCNSGPFAIRTGSATNLAVVPRLCAAFNRASLLLPRGNVQPFVNTKNYYLNNPSNWYAKVVKTFEPDGIGYAFSYDDVTPTGGPNTSGLLADSNPTSLTITIGGPVTTAIKAAKLKLANKPLSRVMRAAV